MTMTQTQAMVVSPILTTLAHGYSNAQGVGQFLFPRVFVPASAGKVITFGREPWRRINTKRAPGANVPKITPKFGSSDYKLYRHDLDGTVPIELIQDANAVPAINLGQRAIWQVQESLAFQLELEQADLARTAANYDTANKEVLAGVTRWTQTTSTPLLDIRDGREAIRAACGLYPNTMVLSAKAKTALMFHADVIDRIKHSTGGVVNDALIAGLTEIPNIYTASNQLTADDELTVSDVWGTDVILAYVDPTPTANRQNGNPSFGYTYTLNGYPVAYQPHWDSDTRSWVYPFADQRQPVLTGMDAAFLIQNAGDNS
jgi:hypothetical protein